LTARAAGIAASRRKPYQPAAALCVPARRRGPRPFSRAQVAAYLQAARDPALRDAVADALATYRQVAEAALVAAGAPPDAAAEAAPAFIALADGFALHHLAHPRPGDVDALRRALRMLFDGLLARAGTAAGAAGPDGGG